MNTSLRDQLLKLGVVTEKQARQASQQEQQRQFRNKPKPGGAPPAQPNRAVQQAQSAKAARDQELNRRREDKAARKARIAQIEQLVEQNRLPRLETDDHFSFVDGKKIRRVAVDAPRREQLMRGELAFVRYKGHYAVVPTETAERIRERDEHMVVPHLQAPSQPQPSTVQDDAYKDFVVPDDLMW
jgi:uncharacterized protein YaiL (DUF2058 family)